jgi:hypothetical protein
MAFTIDGTNGLTFNNATTQASAGVVLQTLSFSLASLQSTSSTTYVSAFLQQAITPKFATSKILITISGGIYVSASGGCRVTLYRDSSNILAGNGFYYSTLVGQEVAVALTYLDSPATTSSINYNLRYLVNSGAGSVYLSINNTTSSITIQEIAA